MYKLRFVLAFSVSTLLFVSAVHAEESASASAPTEGNFFSKLAGAVKKGVEDGVDNGVQSTGSVKILGYTMLYSKLQASNQPAYCLANAETGKLITVAPMFGTPYQRGDGTTGFTQMSQQVDKNHSKIEANITSILPGLNCADLLAQQKLSPYGAVAKSSTSDMAANVQSQGGGCLKPALFIPTTTRHLCGANLNDGIGMGVFDIGTQQLTRFERGQCADYKGNIIAVGKACITISTSFRTDGQLPTPTYLAGGASGPAAMQQAWDKVDADKRDGLARIQAESTARDTANADKSVMRKAAYEKCKPLIGSDNSKMDAFKACYSNATR